jgi:hypothetical protein
LLDPNRVEYRSNPKVHLAEAGPVALSNWVGRIGDKRVRVYRGAQASRIPEAVQKAMIASGVPIGAITLQDLGLSALPGHSTGRGARILTPPPPES